jgi:hypothetical protein
MMAPKVRMDWHDDDPAHHWIRAGIKSALAPLREGWEG